MINELKEVMKRKTFAEIMFEDGESLQGFVIKVNSNSFRIVTFEPIASESASGNVIMDLMGNMYPYPFDEENKIPVEKCFKTDFVSGVTFDVTHKIFPDFLKVLFFVRDNLLFKEIEKPAKPKQIRNKVSEKIPLKTT